MKTAEEEKQKTNARMYAYCHPKDHQSVSLAAHNIVQQHTQM